MSKAFTPIVPSDNYLNDISKISWNNRELFENISYSNITESVLMGRNARLGNTGINNTEKFTRKRSLIWQSKEGEDKHNTIKSPMPRGSKINYRSASNNDRTISSIAGTNGIKNFPPIGFGSKQMSDSLNNSRVSRRASSIKNVDMFNNSSIMSPVLDDTDQQMEQILNSNLVKKPIIGHRRGKPLIINRSNEIEDRILNISRASNEVEPLIVRLRLITFRNIHLI
jgi:hypothetical protein